VPPGVIRQEAAFWEKILALTSAGILLYRRAGERIEVLLVHPGGPFWRSRDQGAWMIPKGGIEAGETAEQAARREFEEELGTALTGALLPLCRIRQTGGKWVEAFAAEGDLDPETVASIDFEMEWPPRSGKLARFPEVDRAAWFGMDEARAAILPSQRGILDALVSHLRHPRESGDPGDVGPGFPLSRE
jgi:predicted NUDIX family NTP pyrophosphohydrolase